MPWVPQQETLSFRTRSESIVHVAKHLKQIEVDRQTFTPDFGIKYFPFTKGLLQTHR